MATRDPAKLQEVFAAVDAFHTGLAEAAAWVFAGGLTPVLDRYHGGQHRRLPGADIRPVHRGGGVPRRLLDHRGGGRRRDRVDEAGFPCAAEQGRVSRPPAATRRVTNGRGLSAAAHLGRYHATWRMQWFVRGAPGPLGFLRRSGHKRLEGVWSSPVVVPIERKDRGGHPIGRRDLDEDRVCVSDATTRVGSRRTRGFSDVLHSAPNALRLR